MTPNEPSASRSSSPAETGIRPCTDQKKKSDRRSRSRSPTYRSASPLRSRSHSRSRSRSCSSDPPDSPQRQQSALAGTDEVLREILESNLRTSRAIASAAEQICAQSRAACQATQRLISSNRRLTNNIGGLRSSLNNLPSPMQRRRTTRPHPDRQFTTYYPLNEVSPQFSNHQQFQPHEAHW